MEHTTFASRLRFLSAADVDDSVVDYDGLDVEGPDGARIGDVAGFIVDAQAARLHYVVVDSGGWFRPRRFLVPVGHANLSGNRAALSVDVTRDALSRYPEFDEDQFSEVSDEDKRVFEQAMVPVCRPEDPADEGYRQQRHHAEPDWWPCAHERLRPVEVTDYRAMPVRERFGGGEYVRAHAADTRREVSRHPERRAQPRDVVGIDARSERSRAAEPSDDENRRRRVAERVIGEGEDEPRRSDR